MDSCKIIMEQAKAMNSTCSTACGGGAGRVRFQGAKKFPDKGEDLNALVYNKLKEVLKTNKHLKAKASSDSVSEDEHENFNFETLNIREY